MSLCLSATLLSRQASFKARSFAQPFARGPGSRNQLFGPCQRCELFNSAQGPIQRKARVPQTPRRETPKPSYSLTSRSRKPAAYEPLSQKLALRASPTLLYRASSHTHYIFGCYATGGGLLAAAWFNFQTQFYVQPGGVPSWVPAFTSIGSFMIACGGFWMLLKVRMVASREIFAVRLTQMLATEHGSGHQLSSIFSTFRARV